MARFPRLEAFREGLVEAVTEDWATKLLALLISVGIWVWVQSELVVEVHARADVHYVWPKELVRVDDVPSSINVILQGPQAVVWRLKRQMPVLPVDLGDSPEGQTTVDFTALNFPGIPPEVKVLRMTPSSVELKLERSMTRRMAIHPSLTGAPPDGYRVLSVKAIPATVSVTGPRSLLKAPLLELATDPLDLSDLRTSRTVPVDLVLPGHAVATDLNGPVQVVLQVEAVSGTRSFDGVPVTLSKPGWSVQPAAAKLTLSGPLPVLNALVASKLNLLLTLPDPAPSGPVVFDQIGLGPGHLSVTGADMAGVTLSQVDPPTLTAEPPP